MLSHNRLLSCSQQLISNFKLRGTVNLISTQSARARPYHFYQNAVDENLKEKPQFSTDESITSHPVLL